MMATRRSRRTSMVRTSATTTTTTTSRPRTRSSVPFLRSSRRAVTTTTSLLGSTTTYNQNFAVNNSCIDLTLDDDEVFVDLTSIGDQSPIVLSASRVVEGEEVGTRGVSDRTEEADILCSDTNCLPVGRRKKISAKRQIEVNRSSSEDEESPTSVENGICCPICLDNLTKIRKNKKVLKSTICGHVFCSECIDEAFRSLKCCPTCRKKLTVKMIHPVYI